MSEICQAMKPNGRDCRADWGRKIWRGKRFCDECFQNMWEREATPENIARRRKIYRQAVVRKGGRVFGFTHESPLFHAEASFKNRKGEAIYLYLADTEKPRETGQPVVLARCHQRTKRRATRLTQEIAEEVGLWFHVDIVADGDPVIPPRQKTPPYIRRLAQSLVSEKKQKENER